jgi:repressor LexA
MLTPKQKAVLEFIEEASRQNGYAPSQQEIAEHFGFKSLGTVQNYLVRLERHGFLRKTWNAKRGMAVLRKNPLSLLQGQNPRSQSKSGSFSEDLDSSTTTPLSSSLSQDSGASLIPLNPSDRRNPSNGKKRKMEAVPTPLSPALDAVLSQSENSVVSLPLLGKVAAGLPIEYAEYDQTVEVPLSLFSRPYSSSHRNHFAENHYVLRVKGDSMIGDGILDGDYVIIEKKNRAEQGETVVAMIGNEATIKRFYQKRVPASEDRPAHQQIELRAANPAYEPILIESLTENDFRIEGIMVGLIRKL